MYFDDILLGGAQSHVKKHVLLGPRSKNNVFPRFVRFFSQCHLQYQWMLSYHSVYVWPVMSG